MVYATDAAISDGVDVLATLPPQSHDPIVYPVAVIKGRYRPEVKKAMALLQSQPATETFRRYGFQVLQ